MFVCCCLFNPTCFFFYFVFFLFVVLFFSSLLLLLFMQFSSASYLSWWLSLLFLVARLKQSNLSPEVQSPQCHSTCGMPRLSWHPRMQRYVDMYKSRAVKAPLGRQRQVFYSRHTSRTARREYCFVGQEGRITEASSIYTYTLCIFNRHIFT